MTTWAPAAIVGFATQAGWQGPDLVVAVAVALAASGGADHALETYPHGTPRQTRGLWAVDVDQVADDVAATLYDPRANAKAAYGLWEANGHSFEWSPAYRSGGWRTYVDAAEQATKYDQDAPLTGGLPPGSNPDGPTRRTVGTLQDIASGAANLTMATQAIMRKG